MQFVASKQLSGARFIFMGYVVGPVATFGENVKRLRERAGMSTSKSLADALGVVPSVVSKIENDLQGLPEGPTLLRLAKAMRCSIDELLEGIDPHYDEMVAVAVAKYHEDIETITALIDGARAQMNESSTVPTDFEERSRDLLKSAADRLRWRLSPPNEELEGSDLLRHGYMAKIAPQQEEALDAAAARIAELETRLEERETQLREAEDATRRLVRIFALGKEDRGPRSPKRQGGSGDRKTG